VTVRRNERVVAYMLGSTLGLSVLCIIALFVAQLFDVSPTGGAWPIVAVLPIIGLPLSMLLIIVLLVMGVLRRGREAKDE
jgi:hypothetical protein